MITSLNYRRLHNYGGTFARHDIPSLKFYTLHFNGRHDQASKCGNFLFQKYDNGRTYVSHIMPRHSSALRCTVYIRQKTCHCPGTIANNIVREFSVYAKLQGLTCEIDKRNCRKSLLQSDKLIRHVDVRI